MEETEETEVKGSLNFSDFSIEELSKAFSNPIISPTSSTTRNQRIN